MKFTKFLKIASLAGVLLTLASLEINAQETRYGAPAYSGAAAFTFGGTLTNFLILPAESSTRNADPQIVGAIPMVTHLDAYVLGADNGTPGVWAFMSTNSSSVFAGNNAASDPRNAVTSATNGAAYHAYSPGTGSNAYWLPGVVPIVTNQFIVIKHQGITPSMVSYEPSIVVSNLAVTYTNSFTNGANQVTTTITTNTAIVLQGTATSLSYPINSGDIIWFQVTNYVMYTGSNALTGLMRITEDSPGGIITGERGKPLLLMGRGTNIQVNANVVEQP